MLRNGSFHPWSGERRAPSLKGFGKIALQEHAAFNFLRRIGRSASRLHGNLPKRGTDSRRQSEYTLRWLQETFPEARDRMVWMPENGVSKRFFAPLGSNRNSGVCFDYSLPGVWLPTKALTSSWMR